MTRVAAYGSYAWRNWKQNHHWTTSGAPADPLGAGNTQLLSNLAVTPKAFYDVRKNITQASGAVSSLADVSGAGTYGPALVQATPANQPTWDGTTINFDGLASPNSDFLLSTSAIAGLDLSTQLTVALVLDLQAAGSAVVPLQIGAAANASPWMRLNGLVTTHILAVNTNSHGTPVSSTAAGGTGNLYLVILTQNVAGTNAQTIEVPATAKVSGSTATAETSGNQLLALGGTTAGTSVAPMRFRALIAWAGGYTTAQRDTLKTWAQTYHGAALA